MSLASNAPSPIAALGVVARAVIKDAVYYADETDFRRAPCGEYDIEHRNGRVGFYNRASHDGFALSLDVFLQHIHEGRISLVERPVAA